MPGVCGRRMTARTRARKLLVCDDRARGAVRVLMRRILIVLSALVAAAGLVTPSGATRSQPPSELVIRTKIVTSGGLYVEGALTYASVSDRHGRVLVTKRIDKRVTLLLGTGPFRVRSWVRPCDGNCSVLDPPTDRCGRAFRLAPGRKLVATIRVQAAHPCVISFRRV